MQHLTIDARKAFDAGIGTYIRNVVPRVLTRLGRDVRVAALVPHDQLDRYAWLPADLVEIQPTHARPLSVAEQFELPRLLGSDTLFWATSLAHPLWRRGPIVATVHDVAQLALARAEGISAPVSLASRLLLGSLRRRAAALLAVSAFTRDEFVRRVGPPAGGLFTVAPLGVDEAWFGAAKPDAERDGEPSFICVGSVRPHKNVARLLQAFVQVADRVPHRLVIAGLAARPNEHATWLAGLRPALRERIRFTGLLPDTELRSRVACADALVFPSLYEGFGLPALEAMAAGCPVLTSNAGALPEVCGSAAAGSFDPRSIDQIAQALLQHAALSSTQRQAIVARGMAHARAFTWDRTADLTADAIRAALRQTARKP